MRQTVLKGVRDLSCYEKLLDELERSFPQKKVEPTTLHDEIMYNAGERNVVEWLKHSLKREG